METVIGLEIHAQLKTESKMFCRCRNEAQQVPPNTNICPICLGHPGTLPVINAAAVRFTVLAGLALSGKISDFSKFDRKSYFYPDLPKGYQVSQYDRPIVQGGELVFPFEKKDHRVRLRRIHLEEDAGKLIHAADKKSSLVDYNRSGTPLMEIVTEPDLRAPAQARIFLQEVQKLLRTIRVSDADMEKGQMRCDANISVRDGVRTTAIVEIKNMNSFRSVERALSFEEARLRELLSSGKEKETVKETRGWSDVSGVTTAQRSKEEAHDYRYFPEPDLPPLRFDEEFIASVRRELPEMPREREKRLIDQVGVKEADAKVLAADPVLADFFENTVSELDEWLASAGGTGAEDRPSPKAVMAQLCSNWVLSELMKYLKSDGVSANQIKINPENMAEFISLVHRRVINSSTAQRVLKEMYQTGKDPSQIIDDKDWRQVSDDKSVMGAVEQVIKNNPGPVADFKRGKQNALQYLIGQVMKATKGKVDPQKAREVLRAKLK